MLPHVSKVDGKPIHDGVELLLRGEEPLLEYREWGGIVSGSLVVHVDHEPSEKLSGGVNSKALDTIGRDRPK